MQARHSAAFAAAVLVTALAAHAPAGVDLEIDPNAKVSGTLDGGDDLDTFRFEGTAGAVLSLTAKAKKKADIDFEISLEQDGGDPVDLTGGKAFQDKGKSVKAKGVVLPANGTYVLRVGGTGEGLYALKLKTKPQKTFAGRRVVPGAQAVPFEFSAPRGAKVVVKVKKAKGSVAAPMVEGGSVKGAASSLTLSSLDSGGLQSVVVGNTAAADGELDISVKVTPAKRKPEKVDVRASTLGDVPDGGTAVSATVDAAGGGAVLVPFADPTIGGAGVLVPAGALDVDVRISISTSTVLLPPDPKTQQPAGPAVRFGPDGLSFSEAATVTIPWDPSVFPADFDPQTDLRVVRVQSDGTETILIPTNVDVANGLCTVATPGFSVFMAIAPIGAPNLEGASYWIANLELCMLPDDLFNGDSRAREMLVFKGVADFVGPPATGSGIVTQSAEAILSFTHDSFGDVLLNVAEKPPQTASGDWFYLFDGQTIGMGLNSQDGFRLDEFSIGDDGSVLINRSVGTGADPCVALDILLRRPETAVTNASVAGTYHLGGLDVRAEPPHDEAAGPAFLEIATTTGSITLDADGTWTADLSTEAERFVPGSGLERDAARHQPSGSYRIAGTEGLSFLEGSVLLSDDRSTDFLRLLPSADGQTIVAFSERLDEGGMFYVGTRTTSGFDVSRAAGSFAMREVVVEPLVTYQVFDGQANRDIPDWGSIDGIDQRFTISADGTADFAPGHAVFINRNPLNVPAGVDVFPFDGLIFEQEKLVGASDGALSTRGGHALLGAFRRDGGFGFFVSDPSEKFEPSLTLFVRLPPEIQFEGEGEPPPRKR